MKRLMLICVVLSLFLCAACGGTKDPVDNNKNQDNFVYIQWKTSQGFLTPYRINVQTGTGAPVCSDPLCNHATYNCPFFKMSTTGLSIIGNSIFYLRDNVVFRFFKQVCRYDIDTGRLIVIYENDAATLTSLSVFDDFAFFLEFVSEQMNEDHLSYSFNLIRYNIRDGSITDLGNCGLSQNAKAYAYNENRVYWKDPDGDINYFSTDPDFNSRLDGDQYENLMFEGDYNIDLRVGENAKYPVYNIPYSFNVVSRNILTGEEKTILKNTPAFPMIYGGKIFYFEYQEEPLIVGYYDDENGNKTDNPIYDPRGHKLYICDFSGDNKHLLSDFSKEYCFSITSDMLGKSGNGDYFVVKMQNCKKSPDGVSLEMIDDVIMIININTGDYRTVKME